ncbi:hypothetical protein Ae201684_018151 [Aphanomyces euteiches]|uniref:Uncharacterized protein n=1 Tax=Aphanomyces euteiches TaxID=100861 RepID=A0A6G0W6F2_9STRA|nr:hypothetical protein Ae201684_018151 [Aphanomyces euteiches]
MTNGSKIRMIECKLENGQEPNLDFAWLPGVVMCCAGRRKERAEKFTDPAAGGLEATMAGRTHRGNLNMPRANSVARRRHRASIRAA